MISLTFFALFGLANADVSLSTRQNDAQFERRQTVLVFDMSTAMAAQQAEISALRVQLDQLGTSNSPIAIGVNAIATDMTNRTIHIVTQQAAMSTQVASVSTAVSTQLDAARTAAAAAAAEASTAFAAAASSADAAAASRATAANAQIQTALGAITTSVSRTVAGLETNVNALVATVGGTGDGSTPKNAGRTCTVIKAAFPSSANGLYYVSNPVNVSDTSSTAHPFGEQGPGGTSVLKVFCNFANRWVTADASGGLFRLDYVDGMIEPYEIHAFNALYMFNIAGAAGGERNARTPNGQKGGLGAHVRGAKAFNRGDRFFAYPGGKGGMQGYEDHAYYDDMWSVAFPKVHVGGWNGGGRGTRGGSGGGGGSDIRTRKHDYSTKAANLASLNTRIATAGGGGGCGSGQCQYRGGHGGGTGNAENAWNGAYGGQQSRGGHNNYGRWEVYGYFGTGGSINTQVTRNDGGGGGGGWYGGSAAATDNRPGAGGSSNARGLSGDALQSGASGGNTGHGYVEFKWQERE